VRGGKNLTRGRKTGGGGCGVVLVRGNIFKISNVNGRCTNLRSVHQGFFGGNFWEPVWGHSEGITTKEKKVRKERIEKKRKRNPKTHETFKT